MVTILRKSGFRFVVYKDDHEPAHVHAIKDGEVIINLQGPDGEPEIRQTYATTRADIRKAPNIAKREQAILLEKWKEIHGGTD